MSDPEPEAVDRPPIPTDEGSSRRRALLYTLPFLLLGLGNVALVIGWGLEPLWVFAMLPPILFVTVITWIAFKSGFVTDHDEYGDGLQQSEWDYE
ncbi:hypothetical protein [Natronorarus salvus]|uniref:hypothetical protein n=1 Tax=Natronorarus salvus TaxID=3117733 RepID=UPI002F26CFC2